MKINKSAETDEYSIIIINYIKLSIIIIVFIITTVIIVFDVASFSFSLTVFYDDEQKRNIQNK